MPYAFALNCYVKVGNAIYANYVVRSKVEKYRWIRY